MAHPPSRPLVSIVLPACNAATTLEPCLVSIARQTLTAWECVIIDDGSSDGTREIACEAARRDSRICVVATPHRGLIAALNEGIGRCRAPLIARMDADDLMRRERLEVQAAALQDDPTLSAVGSHVRLFPRRTMSPRLREYEAWLNGMRSVADIARDAFVECPVAHPTLMMRQDMAALGYLDRGWPEDFDLILRALGARMRVGVVPRRLVSWRDGPRRMSRSDGRYGLTRFVACRAHYLSEQFLSASDRYVLWGYGGTGRALRAALAALGKHPSFIVEVKPTRLGQRIHGAPVIAPEALATVGPRRLVVSVAREGPRTEIRAALSTMGFVEGKDYVCAA